MNSIIQHHVQQPPPRHPRAAQMIQRVTLGARGILTFQDATHALALLRPLIRAEQYHAALADLALLERK